MKVPFSKLEIRAEAEQTEGHPKVFKSIQMKYRINTALEHNHKVVRAVTLSQEKYCGVSAMLSKACPINFSVEFI